MKGFLQTAFVFLCIVDASLLRSQQQVFDEAKFALQPFAYNEVKLTGGNLKTQFDEVESFYLSISNDDLLKGFRQRAGLPTNNAKDLGGWYSNGVFHVFGQLLSGYSRLYAVSGHEAVKTKLDFLIDEWAKCIDSTGYFFYQKPKPGAWNSNEYVYDKMVGGLVDAFIFAGNKKALTYLNIITDWAVKALNRKGSEWYTLSENLYRAYAVTSDKKYSDFAKEWEYTSYWDVFASNKNVFAKDGDYHAYSHLNTISGAAASYLINGDAKYKAAIENAYTFFQNEQCMATGGFGPNERLFPKEELGEVLKTSHASFETQCGSWAAFKLCKYLLEITGDARYGDWIEKLLINGLGVNIPMTAAGFVQYYSDYNPREATVYHANIPWTCCTGTRLQGVGEYANLIYFRNAEGLYVNLYTPSQAAWNGLSITQSTAFPESNTIEFTISSTATASVEVSLHFRKPSWLKEPAVITVNEKAIQTVTANNWLAIKRQWKGGDKIKLLFPMQLSVERLENDKPYPAALVYGPVAMAINGTDDYPEDLIQLATLATDFKAISNQPLNFSVKRYPSLTLRPYYQYRLGEPYLLYIDPSAKNRVFRKDISYTGNWAYDGPKSSYYTAAKGATTSTSFTGTGIKVFFTGADDAGKASILVDEKELDTVDIYSTKKNLLITREYKGFAPAKHTITIVVNGEKSAGALNSRVYVNGFELIN